MKILYITNGFPPHRWAGTETYTAGIAKGMQLNTHSVWVICCGEWDEGPDHWNGFHDDEYNDIMVRRLNINWQKAPDPNRYLYNNPIVSEYIDQFLKSYKPDLVHITSCETLSASVIETVNRNHIPLILSLTDFWFLCPRINLLHGDGSNCNGQTTTWDCLRCMLVDQNIYRITKQILPEQALEGVLTAISQIPTLTKHRGMRGWALDMRDRKAFLRRIFSLPDVRLTASQFVKDIHVQGGFNDQIFVHPYGHDLAWMQEYQGKTTSSKLRIGFIGQIIPSKGVHLLVEAASHLSNAYGAKISFHIYGNHQKDPEYGSKLRAMAEGFGNIEFCGTYKHEESARVFSTFDVLVVPSLWYDFPLVIYEAFATQTPIIASNLGGMAEAVQHEKNGLLFVRGDVGDLENQLKRLVYEPHLLSKLTEGIPPVKTIADEVKELQEIYNQAIFDHQKREN